jgi:hypothetical protein
MMPEQNFSPEDLKPEAFKDPKQALAFMFAGNATVTLKSLKTGDRRTFKIVEAEKRNPKDLPLYFVNLMNGPDNENDFVYVGIVRNSKFTTTKASKLDMNSIAVKAFVWALEHLQKSNVMPEVLEVWPSGHCGRCGRKLNVPASVKAGYGPECIHFVTAAAAIPTVAVPVINQPCCPHCKRTDFANWALAKRHVKFCTANLKEKTPSLDNVPEL